MRSGDADWVRLLLGAQSFIATPAVRFHFEMNCIGWGKCDVLLKDPKIVVIEASTAEITVFRKLDLDKPFVYGERFSSEDETQQYVKRCAAKIGRPFKTEHDVIGGVSAEGHQVELRLRDRIEKRGHIHFDKTDKPTPLDKFDVVNRMLRYRVQALSAGHCVIFTSFDELPSVASLVEELGQFLSKSGSELTYPAEGNGILASFPLKDIRGADFEDLVSRYGGILDARIILDQQMKHQGLVLDFVPSSRGLNVKVMRSLE